MGKLGKFDVKGLQEFQDKLKKLDDPDALLEACAKELAARLLARCIKKTVPGQYPASTGKKGGTLRRGWTVGEIVKDGHTYKISIINPVEYASYVEYGHRTRNHKGWVKGKFMMTLSENEIQDIAPRVLEKKLFTYMKNLMQ